MKTKSNNRDPHPQSPALKTVGTEVEDTADQSNDLSDIDRRRVAIDAAKVMIRLAQRDLTYWQQELADLESNL